MSSYQIPKPFMQTTHSFMFIRTILGLLSLIIAQNCWAATSAHQDIIKQLRIPQGFVLSIFADSVPNARSMALAEDGTVFVGSGAEGKVYAVKDSDGDGKADLRYIIARQLYLPNGVAYRNGALYVAEVNRIIRYDHITEHLANPPKPVTVYDQFPSEQHHGWKYLRFGPDQKLYTSVGAPCNVCQPDKTIYGSLVRINTDGTGLETLATGIRSSVGFDWQPDTQRLFFTDNGRDHLGDDQPADELNRLSQIGEHFGFPYCHAGEIPDPEFAQGHHCREFTAPAWKFNAHMAPLGVHFYRGNQFPVEFRQQLLVAEHGSWNRSEPQGYRVVLIKFDQNKPVSEQVIIQGWLTPAGDALGRPVDLIELPNGSMLISDDKLGVIYKLDYVGNHG